MTDPSAPPRETCTQKLAERTSLLQTFERRHARLGTLRLFVFLAAAAILWFTHWYWIAIPFAAFFALVWRQSQAERNAGYARRAIRFYEQGIARLEHRWQDQPAQTGERFADPQHPYAADLNLFGRASLFQLLSTARTRGGEERLAAWLKSPASTNELRARQQAVNELRPLLDLRESLAILGGDITPGIDPARLANWAAAPAQVFPAWKRALAFALSILALLALAWFLTDNPDARLALLVIALINGLFAVPQRARILAIAQTVEEPARDLDLFSQILAILETRQFESPLLKSLREAIHTDGRPASRRIARLRGLTDMLDSRDNPVVRAVGPIVLWTTQVSMAIENWRAENGRYVPAWLHAVSEIEALSSLANFAWEHPADPFPEFSPDTRYSKLKTWAIPSSRTIAASATP